MDPIAEQLIKRLRNDPSDSAAYEGLKAHYQHGGDFASLVNLLEGWASNHADDWENASQACAEAAEVVLRGSGDNVRAKALYRRALEINLLHPEAGAKLQTLLEQQPGREELVEFLDSYAQALESAGASQTYVASLYRRLGELWEQELGRPDLAASYNLRASQLEAAAGSAAAPSAPASQEDARALADRCEQEALDEQDPARKAALLSQLAELRANQLDELEGAIAALRQALAALPGDVAVMHQLAVCLLARAEGAEPEAARTDHRRVAELFYQIAQGVDESEALPYLESALCAMPDHDGALALLERLAPLQQRSEILPGYWVSYVAAAGEGPEVDQRRLLLGEAYLQSDQLDDAVYCLQAAAEHGNERAHELLQQAYARQAGSKPSERAPGDEPQAPDPSHFPTNRPPARDEQQQNRNAAEIAALRKRAHEAQSARNHDEAAEHCRAILALDGSDLEAFNVLESHYRKRRDYASLRDLLLASTRMPGLSVDARKLRLREVATLSETKLRDAEGATSAFRGVVTLDPADRDALASLKRLLKKAQNWDELASVLEREALATTALEDTATLLREIALLHRDKRKDPVETAEALRQLYALKPDDSSVRDELCDLLIEVEQWVDAAPLLRERVATAKDEIEKLKLSGQLAAVLHERLDDLEGAFEVCTQILAWKPSDKGALDRMERIDQQSGNYSRLLSTLERRALLAPKAERPALFTRMGVIAEEHLHDIDKASDYFGDALDLAPDRQDALSHMVELFDRAGRYEQLVELLRERALLEKDPKNRAPLCLRIAQTLAERLDDQDGAADAYRRLLELEENEEALRFLRDVATRKDDPQELADMLRRLCARTEDRNERRDLSFDLACVLHDRLGRTPEASGALKRIVEELDPSFEPAIELLGSISEATSDRVGLALSLERRIALSRDPATRLPLAKRLADLCEQEPRDDVRAIAALQAWVRDETQNPEPRRRLRQLLETSEQWPALLVTLDALAEWEHDFDARDEATIAAARTAFEHMQDAQGAWRRLLPLVEERSEQAEQALREIAHRAGLEPDLAALYVRLAQQTEDPMLQGVYWGNAADLFEHQIGDPSQAFEASLRRLATDLSNRELLTQVDRLAVQTKAFRRLSQVYDRLLKQAEDDDDKVALLKRHAELLLEEQPDEALDRIVRACALAPHDEGLLSRAEDLAQRTRRSEELLVVYDRRRARSEDDGDKVRLLLRAAKLCDGALQDRERANQYLKNALAVAGASAELGAEVDGVARELDAARPELGADGVRRALVRAHREVAEIAEPAAAVQLLLRAAVLLQHELDDERGAFDMLRQALGMRPKSDEIYAALFAMAEKQTRLDSLDAHVSRLIDEAIDSATAVALLRRRGALLEGPLNRFQDAAAAYAKLLQLRPDDADAAEKLRKSLRHSGRHQDLLLVLNKQLQRTREPEARVSLLREIALTWEQDLKNRWEALDAWKAVLREAEGDSVAMAAVQRLERGRANAPATLTHDSEAPQAEPEAPAVVRSESAGEQEKIAGADQQAPAESERASIEASSDAPPPATQVEPEPAKKKKRRRKAKSQPDEAPAPAAAVADEAPAQKVVTDEPQSQPAAVAEAQSLTIPTEEGAPREAPADEPSTLGVAAEGPKVPSAQAQASPPAPRFESESEADLESLDAALRATSNQVEEVDVFETVSDLALDVVIEPIVRPPQPSVQPSPAFSTPSGPPIPSLAARASGVPTPSPMLAPPPPPPPPPPGARAAAPPLPPGARRSAPPPPPQGARRSAPPPLPPQGLPPSTLAGARAPAPPARASSAPPPLPSVRASSQPPPLPTRANSQPPPLPAQRKQP